MGAEKAAGADDTMVIGGSLITAGSGAEIGRGGGGDEGIELGRRTWEARGGVVILELAAGEDVGDSGVAGRRVIPCNGLIIVVVVVVVIELLLVLADSSSDALVEGCRSFTLTARSAEVCVVTATTVDPVKREAAAPLITEEETAESAERRPRRGGDERVGSTSCSDVDIDDPRVAASADCSPASNRSPGGRTARADAAAAASWAARSPRTSSEVPPPSLMRWARADCCFSKARVRSATRTSPPVYASLSWSLPLSQSVVSLSVALSLPVEMVLLTCRLLPRLPALSSTGTDGGISFAGRTMRMVMLPISGYKTDDARNRAPAGAWWGAVQSQVSPRTSAGLSHAAMPAPVPGRGSIRTSCSIHAEESMSIEKTTRAPASTATCGGRKTMSRPILTEAVGKCETPSTQSSLSC